MSTEWLPEPEPCCTAEWTVPSSMPPTTTPRRSRSAMRLSPIGRLERIVAEVHRVVRWLAKHLAEYGADPNRLYVAGHSAGGHLTAMTMPLPEVRGGIAISGIYDLEPIRL